MLCAVPHCLCYFRRGLVSPGAKPQRHCTLNFLSYAHRREYISKGRDQHLLVASVLLSGINGFCEVRKVLNPSAPLEGVCCRAPRGVQGQHDEVQGKRLRKLWGIYKIVDSNKVITSKSHCMGALQIQKLTVWITLK